MVAPELPPSLEKALDQTMQGIAKVYAECHKLDPDSPLCEAVLNIQKAMAEVGKNVGQPSDPAAEAPPEMGGAEMPPEGDPMAAGAEPPMDMGAEVPMDEEPLPPGASIEDAAGATHQMMMEAAARRRLGQ
jgi:hypothetical protein